MARSRKRKRRLLRKIARNLPRGYSLSGGYLRLNGKYDLDFILMNMGPWEITFKGHSVRMYSLRYLNFQVNGTDCVRCGLRGRYFRLERHALDMENEGNRFHFNLYAVGRAGEEILMTQDHILPKSLGGVNTLGNLQTMCRECNERKGNNEEK